MSCTFSLPHRKLRLTRDTTSFHWIFPTKRKSVQALLWFVAITILVFLVVQLKYFKIDTPTIRNWMKSKDKELQLKDLTKDQLTRLQLMLECNKTLKSSYKLPSKRLTSRHTSFFPSKFINVRAVYFDDRRRNGHKNSSVFLANVLKNITDNKLIVACQIGKIKTEQFDVNLIGETPLWRAYPSLDLIDHEEVIINCYDVPCNEGDLAFLYYKTSENSDIEVVVSERPLRWPESQVKPTSPEGIKYNFTVLTCTKIFGGNAPWFIEWIKYQKTIGIDHLHLNVDDFFFRELSKDKMAYVVQEMKEGFLTVDPWVTWLQNGKEIWYHNQGLILEDCGYRFRGTYDYMFILDTDDFFVPRVPNEIKVHYFLNKYFKSNVGSCKMRWVEYFPDYYLLDSTEKLVDGNVTSLLTNFTHYMHPNRKSVHSTSVLLDTATHFASKMLEGYRTEEMSVKEAYVAHLRKARDPSFNPKGGMTYSELP